MVQRIYPNDYFKTETINPNNLTQNQEVQYVYVPVQDQNGRIFFIVGVVAIVAIVCTTLVVLYKISKVK